MLGMPLQLLHQEAIHHRLPVGLMFPLSGAGENDHIQPDRASAEQRLHILLVVLRQQIIDLR